MQMFYILNYIRFQICQSEYRSGFQDRFWSQGEFYHTNVHCKSTKMFSWGNYYKMTCTKNFFNLKFEILIFIYIGVIFKKM